MAKLVEVRPIEVKKWHGKKGQESFTRPKKIQALIDPVTMQYATGLTEEDIAKLREKGVTYDLSPNVIGENNPHPFWDSNLAVIKLENNTMFFDRDKPLEYIKISIMKASKFVANSIAEYEQGLFPDATHVIYDEQEQVESKASKVEAKNQAIIEASKISKDRKIQLVLVLGGKNLRNQSDNFISVAIDEIISKDPEAFLRYIKKDKKEVANLALATEALQKHILRKEGHKILYMDSVLGDDLETVASYLGSDENQDLKMNIMQKLVN